MFNDICNESLLVGAVREQLESGLKMASDDQSIHTQAVRALAIPTADLCGLFFNDFQHNTRH